MQLLAGLKQLLHEDGLTIKGAQKIMRERGVKYVASLSSLPVDGDIADPATCADNYDTSVEEAPYIDVESEAVVSLDDDQSTVVPFGSTVDDDSTAPMDMPEAETTTEMMADTVETAPTESADDIPAAVDATTKSDSVDDEPAFSIAETATAEESEPGPGIVQGSLLDLLGIPASPAPVAEPAAETDPVDITLADDAPVADSIEQDTPPQQDVGADIDDDIVPEDSSNLDSDAAQTDTGLPPEPDLTAPEHVAGPLSQIAALTISTTHSAQIAQLLPKLAHLAGLSSDAHID